MCFQCGGGLMNWEETHSAWEEHALWFPTCSFVSIMKGKDFIERVHQAALEAVENVRIQIIKKSVFNHFKLNLQTEDLNNSSDKKDKR